MVKSNFKYTNPLDRSQDSPKKLAYKILWRIDQEGLGSLINYDYPDRYPPKVKELILHMEKAAELEKAIMEEYFPGVEDIEDIEEDFTNEN